MDIRNFFGGKPGGSSAAPSDKKPSTGQIDKAKRAPTSKKRAALTDEADQPITPQKKRPRTAKVQEKTSVVNLDLDTDSDSEEPLKSKYRKKLQHIISSDEEENIEQVSASQLKKKKPSPKQQKKSSPKQEPAKKKITEKIEKQNPSNAKSASMKPIEQSKSQTKNAAEKPKAQQHPKLTSNEPALNLREPAEKLEQWVDKYRPTEMKSIIGQHTEQAPANKLMRWLKDWPRNNLGLVTTKKNTVVGTSAKNDGSAFRAALLSGPPGIGKTTMATLVCKELGLRYLELNASVARNKKMLDQKVSELIHSRRVDEYFGAKSTEQKPVIKSKRGIRLTHVLIMDEVDGMAGNQDRAGVSELIQFIKKSEIPILCICNDRQSQKVRALANYCFDLRVQRPRMEQILGRMMTIAAREKLKITKDEVEQVIKASQQDMRQSIYSLQLMAAGKDSSGVVAIKDVSINTFEAARQLLSADTNITRKRELFFTDYSLMPLFVQENYLQVRSSTLGRNGQMRAFRDAANSICMGEMVSRQIWSSQNWSLLPLQGVLSTVLPPLYLKGYTNSDVRFPAWLGKQSNQGKRLRLLRELDEHMGLKMSGPLSAISVDYIPMIRNAILKPLMRGDSESIEEALDVYHAYDLVKDDLEAINELGMWNEKDDMWKQIKSTVKASLTRALGKDNHKKHYSTADDIKIQARSGTAKRGAAKAAKEKIKAVAAEDEEIDEQIEDEETSDLPAYENE